MRSVHECIDWAPAYRAALTRATVADGDASVVARVTVQVLATAKLVRVPPVLSAPTHALVPGDDGPPSVLRTNDAQHPRQHTAISALLPNDHERSEVRFFCKKTRYHANGKRVGVFGGVWRRGVADSNWGICFGKREKGSIVWTGWYTPASVGRDPANLGVVVVTIPGGNGDYWRIEMDRMKYTEWEARAKAREVAQHLRVSMQL